eukprot:gene2210-2525_t
MGPVHDGEEESYLQTGRLLATKLYRVLVALLVYSVGFATLIPVLPTILTNFFASRHAGTEIDCQQFSQEQQPAACQDAHAVIGDLSDNYGRKPFILAGLALSLLPMAVVWLYLQNHVSLLWYYPLNALTSAISSFVIFLSYAADILPPQHRTSGFGLIVASFMLGFMVGPFIGGYLTPSTAAATAVISCLATIGIVAVAVPESRPVGSAGGATVAAGAGAASSGVAAAGSSSGTAVVVDGKVRRPRPLDALLSFGKSWRLINSSTLFQRLAVCMVIVGIVSEGIQDMLVQYLQLVLGFTTSDQSLLFTILGGTQMIVQAVLLPILVARLGERRLLVLGLVFSFTEQVFLALSVVKWQAFAAVALGSMAGVSFPAISSIKSTHSREDQQGLVQGALAGIRALATGLGPLAFAQLFAMCTKTSSGRQ